MIPDDVSTPETPATPAVRSRRKLHAVHEVRERRRRFVTWGLLLGSFVLIVNALFGEHGYLAAVRARQEYATVSDQADRVKDDNQHYVDEIRGIKSDPAMLEAAARRELGLIKPGETIIIIRDARPASVPAPPK